MDMSSNTKATPSPANRKAFGAFVAAALLSLTPLDQAQAQLYIDIYPSQDNPSTHTLWVFSGSSTTSRTIVLFGVPAHSAGTFRTSSGNSFNVQDSVSLSSDPFSANSPSNTVLALSPFSVSGSSTNYPKDYDSIRRRIPGGTRTQTFAANATNTPTISIAPNSSTISHMYLHGATNAIGARVSSSFNYNSAGTAGSTWYGSGLLAKPIGDFTAGTYGNSLIANPGTFFSRPANNFQVRVHSAVIPEPEEYALVFGLFALGFVILRRHFQKKRPTNPI